MNPGKYGSPIGKELCVKSLAVKVKAGTLKC